MVRSRSPIILLAVGVLTLLLSACGSPTPTVTPQPLSTTVNPTATNTVAATTAAPTQAATAAALAAPTEAATQAVAAVTTAAATEAATATATSSPSATNTVAPTTAAATEAATATATSSPSATNTVALTTPAATEAVTTAATEAATVSATSAPTQEVLVAKPSTLPQCAAGGTLTVGSDATYPPFESINEKTGKIEGFDVDILNAIGQKEGFTLDFHNALFDTIFTALSYGQYDVVASASTITAERQKTVNFSNPYFIAGQVIVARQADASLYKTPADLAGKLIGVQNGTTGAEAAKAIPNTKGVKAYDTAPEAFQALANGDVDAVVNDNVTSLSIILNSPTLKLAVIGQPFTSEFYGIAVRKDCTDLLAKINAGLSAVIADGTYATIYEKYLGEQPPSVFSKGSTGLNGVPTPEATASTSGSAATAMATEVATSAATP